MRPRSICDRLVAVVGSLVRAVNSNPEVVRLGLREGGELHADLCEVGAGDLLVELLRENVHAEREVLRRRPERDLGENLIRERARHDKRWVARCAAEIDEAARREEDDMTPIRHSEAVDLWLDVNALLRVLCQPSDIDFDVEVANASKR